MTDERGDGRSPLEDAKASCQRGWEKYDEDNKAAAEWFERAIKACPEHPDGWYGRAVARLQLGQTADAIQDLDQHLKLEPNSYDGLCDRGFAYRNSGNKEAALRDYTRAIELDGKNPRAVRGRGFVWYFVFQDWKKAEEAFDRTVELGDDEDPLIYFYRAWTKARQNRYAEAVEDYGKAIKLDPRNSEAWLNRAYLKRELQDYPGAIVDFGKAIELGIKQPEAFTAEIAYLENLIKTGKKDTRKRAPFPDPFTGAVKSSGCGSALAVMLAALAAAAVFLAALLLRVD